MRALLPVLAFFGVSLCACPKSESAATNTEDAARPTAPAETSLAASATPTPSAPPQMAIASAAPEASVKATAVAAATAPPPGATKPAASTAPRASAAAATPSADAGVTCGTKPLPDCPLQAWMKANTALASASGDLPSLAVALDKIAAMAPGGYGNWASISKDGASAARGGTLDAARASCTSCHKQYRDKYRAELRTRPVP